MTSLPQALSNTPLSSYPERSPVAVPRRTIALDGELVQLAGDGNTALFLRQCLFWWQVLEQRPFYKFNAPAPNQSSYRPGDSWTEELGLSRSQFETARKRVAVKVAGKDAAQIESALTEGALVIYWTTEDHRTWYWVNAARLRELAPDLYDRLLRGEEEHTTTEPQEVASADPSGSFSMDTPPSWTRADKAAQEGSHALFKETVRASLPPSVPPTPAAALTDPAVPPEHQAPASLPTPLAAPATRERQRVTTGQDGSATHVGPARFLPSNARPDAAFRHPECRMPAFPDVASPHSLMQGSCIGIIRNAEMTLQRGSSKTIQRYPALPPTARTRDSQEEEGRGAEERQSVGPLEQQQQPTASVISGAVAAGLREGPGLPDDSAVRSVTPSLQRFHAQEEEDPNRLSQTQIQQALEARAVFPDPARLIAARAVRQGLGVAELVDLFEAHLRQAEREQARNPLGAVVWRLQHQPLRLPRRSAGYAARWEEVRTFLDTPLAATETEQGSEVWQETAGALPSEEPTEEEPTTPAEPPEPADELRRLWQRVLADLQLQMTRATFERWLKDTELARLEAGVYVVSTPNSHAPELLEHRLGRLIRQTLQRHVGEGGQVRYVVRHRAGLQRT